MHKYRAPREKSGLDKIQKTLLAAAFIVFVGVLLFFFGMLIVGYFIFSVPDPGNYQYASYNDSVIVTDFSLTQELASASQTFTCAKNTELDTVVGGFFCSTSGSDTELKYLYECQSDGTWSLKETCATASACNETTGSCT